KSPRVEEQLARKSRRNTFTAGRVEIVHGHGRGGIPTILDAEVDRRAHDEPEQVGDGGHVLDDAFDHTSVVRARGERVNVNAGEVDRVANDQVPERIGEGDADMADGAVRPFMRRQIETLEAAVHLSCADTVDVGAGAT